MLCVPLCACARVPPRSQDPANRRNIIVDEKLATLFTPPITMFNMNKQLSKHVFTSGEAAQPRGAGALAGARCVCVSAARWFPAWQHRAQGPRHPHALLCVCVCVCLRVPCRCGGRRRRQR
jgi:hypothetical protein